jgi:SET domain-containing protein
MTTWLSPKIEVRPSPIQGKGLFARELVPAGEQLTRRDDRDYTVMTDQEFAAYIKTVSSWDAVALGNGTHRVSKVSRDDDPANYGNHSCDPNADSNAGGLVANRNIQVDEEITCDYAPLSSSDWSMECNCGAKNCRGIVTGMR